MLSRKWIIKVAIDLLFGSSSLLHLIPKPCVEASLLWNLCSSSPR